MAPFFHQVYIQRSVKFLFIGYLLLHSITSYTNELNSLPTVKNRVLFSFEELLLPQNEAMGLMGANYLFSMKSFLDIGLGVYGATRGERGGFFTGGLDTRIQFLRFKNISLGLGGFVGGGGGGGAPQGGGLMLRGSLDSIYQIDNQAFGLGYSVINFPNGNINSKQFSFYYHYLFDSIHQASWQIPSVPENIFTQLLSTKNQFSLHSTSYILQGKASRSGSVLSQRQGVLGVRWKHQLYNNLWTEFETAGALQGNIDGFAQILGGVAYVYPFARDISFSSGLLLGAAGGGDVDTAGGAIGRFYGGLTSQILNQWFVSVNAGWTQALSGKFHAITLAVDAGYQFESFKLRQSNLQQRQIEKVSWRPLRFRPGVQRYLNYQKPSRKFTTPEDNTVDLVTLKLDVYSYRNIYWTGQALGAFDGGAGGYAVGLVGPGIEFNKRLSAELLFGAAGGGGIAVGSGQIVQPMLNFNLPINNLWSGEVSAGYIYAPNGNLSAYVLNFGVVYHFMLAETF